MTAVTPEEFYQANIDREKEYVCINVAYQFKAGEKIPSIYHLVAEEDGYKIGSETLTKAEFAARATPIKEGMELPLPKRGLSEEELGKITPVKPGDRYVIAINDGTNPLRGAVSHDAFIMAREGGNDYMDGFELASRFNNYAGPNPGLERITVFTWNDEQPFNGIILEAKTTFAFKDRERTIDAGSIIFPAPRSEDGYELSCFSPFGSNAINKALRLSPGWTSHGIAVSRQAKLKALRNAQKFNPIN